jgi:HSP20 family protein
MARNVVRYDPFAQLNALARDLFDGGSLTPSSTRMPTTDVYTDGNDALVIEAHLPNFRDEDVNVDVDGGALVIRAERREREEDKSKQYVLRESSSSFYRSVLLPDQADEDKITASFKEGVLTVRVPLTASPAARSIAIESPTSA